ncbi:MAG: hypothetical protein EOO51_09150 [Flavobacterium sp.]|nr:MAG: hypothetical protein EOO51_09150 [Flavobacterium sp.]
MITFFLSILISGVTFGQSKDSTSVNRNPGKSITEKFPTTRVFDVQYELLGPTKYDTELFGQPYEKGKIESQSRVKIASNIVVFKAANQRFFITNSLRYKYENYQFSDIRNIPAATFQNRPDQHFHYLSESVSATYFSTLFKKPVIYNASATVDGNEKKAQRVKGLVSATIVLKKTERTTITIGGVALIDPSSILPFAPVFTYEHQFRESPWKIDIIIPQRILVKRPLLVNGRLSIGTELNSDNFYIRFDNDLLRGDYELNQLELKSGITYEYNFLKNFIGTFKAGINNAIATRITERGRKTSEYVVENNQGGQAYFNFGLSYNPF